MSTPPSVRSPTVLHCPQCRAMQPNRRACGVCGTRLPGYQDPSGQPPVREILHLAVMLLGFLGGLVLLGVGVVYVVLLLL